MQSRALLEGRSFAVPDDVKALAVPVLSHRLVPTAQARMRGDSASTVLLRLLDTLPVPVEPDVG